MLLISLKMQRTNAINVYYIGSKFTKPLAPEQRKIAFPFVMLIWAENLLRTCAYSVSLIVLFFFLDEWGAIS